MHKLPLVFYFYELKLRFYYFCFSLFCTFCFVFYFSDLFVFILIKPINQQTLFSNWTLLYAAPSDFFSLKFKVSLAYSFIFVLPLFYTHVAFFWLNSLIFHEQRKLMFFICINILFLWLGHWLFLSFIFPKTWLFFSGFSAAPSKEDFIKTRQLLFIISYLEISVWLESSVLLIIQGISYFLFIQNKTKQQFYYISKYRKIVLFFFCIVGGILTPPDLWSQLALVLVLYFVTEFFLFYYCFIFAKQKLI